MPDGVTQPTEITERTATEPAAETTAALPTVSSPGDSPSRLPSPSTEPDTTANQSHLWLRRADQLFVGLCLTAIVVLLILYWGRLSGWGLRPVEIERLPQSEYQFRIDVNRATWVEFAQLDGIGSTLAHRIVEDREQNGPFKSIDDLLRVKGIGPKILERMRPHLKVKGAEK